MMSAAAKSEAVNTSSIPGGTTTAAPGPCAPSLSPSFLYAYCKAGGSHVRHRDIDYDVKEDEPSKWRWTIYPKKESGTPVRNETFYGDQPQRARCSR
jgi:hypothetical protein